MRCDIVRDLIPLVIDEAASAASAAAVHDHIAGCRECQKTYALMRSDLPQTTARGGAEFIRIAKRMRRRRLQKRILVLILCLAIGAAVALGGMWGWTLLRYRDTQTVDIQAYRVFLSELQDGSAVASVDFCGHDERTLVEVTEAGSILYITAKRAIWPERLDEPQAAAHWIIEADEWNGYCEIRMGTEADYKAVWKTGESVPRASEEMETWAALERRVRAMVEAAPDADGKLIFSRQEEWINDLWKQWEETRDRVPEWK